MCSNSTKDLIVPCGFFTLLGTVFGILQLLSFNQLKNTDTTYYLAVINDWSLGPIQGIYVASSCDESMINFTYPYAAQMADPNNAQNLIQYNSWNLDGSITSICIDRANFLFFQDMYYNYCDLSFNRYCGDACVPNDRLCPIFAVQILDSPNALWEALSIDNITIGQQILYMFRDSNEGISPSTLPIEQFTLQEAQPCYNQSQFAYAGGQTMCEQNPEYTPVGLTVNEEEFFSINSANLQQLEQNGYQYTQSRNLTVYQKPYPRLTSQCRLHQYFQFINDPTWITELQRAQLVALVFSFSLACFEVFGILPFVRKVSGACCAFNLLMLVILSTSVLVGSSIALNTILSLKNFYQLVTATNCTSPYFAQILKQLLDDYDRPLYYNIATIAAYSLALALLFFFHLYRTYWASDSIAHTVLRPQGAALDPKLERQEIYPAYDIEYIKKQGKVLCVCIICLTNTPPPKYTWCCGQPMHSLCNPETIVKCPNCQRPGRVHLVPFVLFVDRAFMNKSPGLQPANGQIQLSSHHKLQVQGESEHQVQILQDEQIHQAIERSFEQQQQVFSIPIERYFQNQQVESQPIEIQIQQQQHAPQLIINNSNQIQNQEQEANEEQAASERPAEQPLDIQLHPISRDELQEGLATLPLPRSLIDCIQRQNNFRFTDHRIGSSSMPQQH